ncbi:MULTISPECIES: Asp-tRNA(Asn)/Glu-tRNA(Gln) amidotransferase subunit GatC [Limnobacter]|uniref:Aspartyl/glutamyl-tRNA(Asn/Gln) amidotransferase subunit C n=1 Tax=Limnobacter litoralis TaxID=481366 RepID=A0ABQ5YRG0_9BURK|nr:MULTISPECIES: Asp-tRNA(Asn)/Glu-tRNA(Gln) amidotransferase subunit GatC [Limnobacter]GLR25513.1 glutamyl-tRNA(Gln) amidotransferase subunit C [Limnobacter litoralis]HEX5486075.1 Asp-tRNA(Asn)/Glu-tRNA(Gln) amidotransferase subunit GatC [Limnobacter sp.]
MSLNADQVAKVAALARLKLPGEQLLQVQEQLNDIMGLVDQLGEQDTTGVEPLAHPLAIVQQVALRLRPDEVTETDQREANLANAPATQNGLFLVPKVIE